MTHHRPSLALHVIQAVPSATPPSFNGNTTLYAVNLFLMTTVFFLALMLAAWIVQKMWHDRAAYGIRTPLTLRRIISLLVCAAAILRCGGEALLLWGWNPNNPELTARVLSAKRLIDPLALACAMSWMGLYVASEPGIDAQLRRPPPPTTMWSPRAVFFKAGGVVVLSFIMAMAAVLLR